MARGSTIIVSAPESPRGVLKEMYVKTGETWYPGMIVQRDPTVSLISGRETGKIYSRDADGNRPAGAFWVVTEGNLALRGKTMTDSYAAGELASVYAPLPGEEINLLLLNISGTADDHTAGEILMVDNTTGKLIATTGSPETEVAVLLESWTDPTEDKLSWCEWSGY